MEHSLEQARKIIESGEYLVFVFNQATVRMKDYSSFDKVMKVLQEYGPKARNSLVLQFETDEIPEDIPSKMIFNNEEIRSFVKGLYEEYPHIFYFIDSGPTSFLVGLCLCDHITSASPIENEAGVDQYFHVDSKIDEKLKNDIIKQTRMYGFLVGDKEENIDSIINGLFAD